jgi:DNA-binding transcriptional ArsR family regulator
MSVEQVSKCSIIVVQWTDMAASSVQAESIKAGQPRPQANSRPHAAARGQAGAHRESAGAGESFPHPDRDAIELAAVLHALSDPMRLRIVDALAGGAERSCKSFDLPVVKSTCTHHFRVLREAGLIRQRQEGTARLNSLRRTDLELRFPGLLNAVLGAAHEQPGSSEAEVTAGNVRLAAGAVAHPAN